jgi:hypothetical protein
MKKPSNKVIAVYLAWVLIQATLWAIAVPSAYQTSRFFPFYEGKRLIEYPFGVYTTYYDIKPFQIDTVYDTTEFLFYTIVPILIYYIITLLKSKDQTPQ